MKQSVFKTTRKSGCTNTLISANGLQFAFFLTTRNNHQASNNRIMTASFSSFFFT